MSRVPKHGNNTVRTNGESASFRASKSQTQKQKMASVASWRQIVARPSFNGMPLAPMPPPRSRSRFVQCLVLAALIPSAAAAQSQWIGIGAINGTVMFMDTTAIVQVGTVRKVWIKSLDSRPKTFVVANDTVTFDTVIGLNVFDCQTGTRTATAIQYLLGDEIVLDIPETRDKPGALRPGSFFYAIYIGLCRPTH